MSELTSFLITAGRTLASMSLYTVDHPAVKGAVGECHKLLTEVLKDQNELELSLHERKLLVNGKPQENVAESALRPFIQLLNNFNLHSLTFTQGIRPQELIPFFNLATRADAKRHNIDLAATLTQQSVEHIKINQAKYAKIGEDESIGGTPDAAAGEEALLNELGQLTLNDLLTKLVERAIPRPEDRNRVLSRALDLVRSSLDEVVKKVTVEFNKEKTRLTNERERTEEVIGSMAEGVVMVDEKGKVLMMNPTAEQIYGVKLGECLGKPLWEGLREEQMIALAKDLSVPTDRPITKEVQLHAAAETKKTLRTSSATVQDPNGRVVGMVSVLSDVTKQKELTRLQNEFMANVTHDLRTPIHALSLAVAAILEGSAGPVTQEQQKMLSLVTRNVERLARLINDLLDFSQIESGSMQIRPQVIELNPLLRDAVTSLDAWSKSRNISLVFEEAKELLPTFADSDRVLQVVNNLIANAIKFTPQGGRVTLRTKNIKEGGRPMVQVDIEDTGKGISKEDQKRIFDRFVQLENKEKLDIRGTGLGLGICRALVDLHKGKLLVVSPPPGKTNGSIFYFTLPAVLKTADVAPAKVEEAPVVKTKKRGFWSKLMSKFKVVLVVISACAAVSQARPYGGTVRRVLKGDLIQLEDNSKVRYLGVTTPSVGTPYYQEALSANKRLVLGQEVTLRYGLQERDVDGTWIAYVFCNGDFVNQELVNEGLALVAPLSNEEEYVADLLSAERDAHAGKRGMWKDTVIDPYPVRVQKARKK